MGTALKQYWRIYLIEAWALGIFMVSACFFAIVLEHPSSPVHAAITSPDVRRILGAIAMGMTALYLFYSPLGRKSGTHMNPAVTLSFLLLHRIRVTHAVWYIAAQFLGGAAAVFLFKLTVPKWIAVPEVNYVVTVPGMLGKSVAFGAEFVMSFIMFYVVLRISNSRKAGWTGAMAAMLVFLFIALEGPLSGMSINPARTVASSLNAGVWTSWWVYFIAPVAGMLSAAQVFRWRFIQSHHGDCTGMEVHFSGRRHDCRTYEVIFPPKP